MLREKLDQVETRIGNAAARSGRRRSDITLIAVTKKFPAAVIQEAYQLGLREFGENYVQEFEAKRAEIGGCPDARYHLIGHLQSNKAKKAAEIFDVIQTVDTPKLAQRLDGENRPLDVMIEVKLSAEQAKAGAAPERTAGAGARDSRVLASAAARIDDHAAVVGRRRKIAARISRGCARWPPSCNLAELSMGMSHDLEVAIEEGATHGARRHGAVRAEEKRLTVGFFSPLPPARTGVADYSAALLRALGGPGATGDVKVNDASADVCLYHLGNNRLHREIYRRALERPGVIVLHDAVLHHFLLGELERDGVRRASSSTTTAPGARSLARELWRRRARSASDPQYFRYPMLKRVVERSHAVVVHNPAAARMVLEHAPGAAVHEIPHLFEPPDWPDPVEVIRLRRELGLPPHVFLFARVRTPARVQTAAWRAAGLRAGAVRS